MIYPIRYYYRGGVSDKQFILDCMSSVPPTKQKEVSDKYDLLYMQDGGVNVVKGRKEANEYLKAVANHFRGERTPNALANHHKKMIEMAREKTAVKIKSKSGVIEMAPIPKNIKGIQLD